MVCRHLGLGGELVLPRAPEGAGCRSSEEGRLARTCEGLLAGPGREDWAEMPTVPHPGGHGHARREEYPSSVSSSLSYFFMKYLCFLMKKDTFHYSHFRKDKNYKEENKHHPESLTPNSTEYHE